jgi:hypothetical protein
MPGWARYTFLPGLSLMMVAIPWSLCLGNDNRTGRKVYGALAVIASAGVILGLSSVLPDPPESIVAGGLGMLSLTVFVSTILALFNFKRRPDV